MNLEDQVCNLELAMRLYELGVKQESLFCWCKNNGLTGNFIEYEELLSSNIYRDYPDPIKFCSAFTASELFDMLKYYYYEIIKSIRFYEIKFPYYDLGLREDNLVNVLAGMLIMLIEQGIVKP